MKTLLAVVLLFGTTLLTAQSTDSTAKHSYRIMVGEFRAAQDYSPNGQEAELVRSKLISSLSRECKRYCVVTEPAMDEDTNVDAILTGSWLVENCFNCRPRMQGALRLVSKDGTVLWSDTIYSSVFARSISSSFADNTAKKLVASLEKK